MGSERYCATVMTNGSAGASAPTSNTLASTSTTHAIGISGATAYLDALAWQLAAASLHVQNKSTVSVEGVKSHCPWRP